MKRYEIRKVVDGKVVADYGSFTNYEDIKAITKGYKLNKDVLEMFGFYMFTRGYSTKTYYEMDIIES